MLLTEEFNYHLPDDLIASLPNTKREGSKLMVLNPRNQSIEHKTFTDIEDYLCAGDVLVLNDTKVIPARLLGKKIPTGASVEVFLLEEKSIDTWECMVRPAKRLKTGHVADLGGIICTVVKEVDDFRRLIKFDSEGDVRRNIFDHGYIPLPPYISEKLTPEQRIDKTVTSRYQTVYAQKEGATAAPTAGLHFTNELLGKLKEKGVIITYITLHTGLGTFRPVMAENVKDHEMFEEKYEISSEAARNISQAKSAGKRVIAVGTTVTRTLEDCFAKHGAIRPGFDGAKIFIYPPYQFGVVDALITNFHFPKSTLIMLVSAFAGKDFVMSAYKEAVEREYRFFSFGDAMFIEKTAGCRP